MRLIAERALPDIVGQTYVQGELISQPLTLLPRPKSDHTHHLYCSQHNPVAVTELMAEVATELDLALRVDAQLLRAGGEDARTLLVTTEIENMVKCDHVLLYLTGQTWSRGEAETEALATELLQAMELNVHVLLVSARVNSRPSASPRLSRPRCC